MTMRKAQAESTVEAFFTKRVRLLGGRTIKMVPVEAGMPDRLVIMPGAKFYMVELKADDGTLSPKQKHWHAKIKNQQGVRVHVVVGHEGVLQWLRVILNAAETTKTPRTRRVS